MDGVTGLLRNLAFPAFCAGVFAVFVVKYVNWRRPILVLGAVGLGTIAAVAGNHFLQNVIWYTRLARLDAAAVTSIELDGQVIDDDSRKGNLVAALNDIDWYYCNHCSAAEEHLLVLRYADGSSRGFFFNVSDEGAILLLRSSLGKGGYISYGHLKSPQLPRALEDCKVIGSVP